VAVLSTAEKEIVPLMRQLSVLMESKVSAAMRRGAGYQEPRVKEASMTLIFPKGEVTVSLEPEKNRITIRKDGEILVTKEISANLKDLIMGKEEVLKRISGEDTSDVVTDVDPPALLPALVAATAVAWCAGDVAGCYWGCRGADDYWGCVSSCMRCMYL